MTRRRRCSSVHYKARRRRIIDHLSTLDTVNTFGILYRKLGRLDEAEKMYQRVLQGKEKVWGPDHISTLDTVNSLGILYANLGRLEEAEKMYQRARDLLFLKCQVNRNLYRAHPPPGA